MRRSCFAGLFVLCAMVTSPAVRAASVPPPIPEATDLLVDTQHALSVDEQQQLSARLQTIADSGRAQVAVLIVDDTAGEALSTYALRVAESWQLGRAGRDDGLLIVVVPPAAAARIEVGYGLEGDIPDALASQWLDDFQPAIAQHHLGEGLSQLLDRIEAVLPPSSVSSPADDTVLDRHPEWKLPFVLIVFSPFALFPLFFGRWGALASAPLFATFLGGAAWTLWPAAPQTWAVAALALLLPLLWSLNWDAAPRRSPLLRIAKNVGNLFAVTLFFAVVTLFVGLGVSAMAPAQIWAAPLFAGLLALGLGAVLFPGRPARVLMVLLRSLMQFVFVLILAYLALLGRIEAPDVPALLLALAVAASIASSLYLDSRAAASTHPAVLRRWSRVFVVLAIVIVLPIGLLVLVRGLFGDDGALRVAQFGAGGGSVGGVLWWAARRGIGLGGRFGGGGAGRSG